MTYSSYLWSQIPFLRYKKMLWLLSIMNCGSLWWINVCSYYIWAVYFSVSAAGECITGQDPCGGSSSSSSRSGHTGSACQYVVLRFSINNQHFIYMWRRSAYGKQITKLWAFFANFWRPTIANAVSFMKRNQVNLVIYPFPRSAHFRQTRGQISVTGVN